MLIAYQQALKKNVLFSVFVNHLLYSGVTFDCYIFNITGFLNYIYEADILFSFYFGYTGSIK
nr:hypothetical protein [Mucilaginibacter sp. X5P1]